MNKLISHYQSDILTLFKGHYERFINKSVIVTFEQILKSTLIELDIEETNPDEIAFLKSWFVRIHHLDILDSFLDRPFEELMIHGHSDLQLITNTGKKEFLLEDFTPQDLQLSLEVLALKNGVSWNYKEPFASFDVTLKQKHFRATLVHYSTSANKQSKLFLRASSLIIPKLEMFQLASHEEMIIRELLASKKNILISGGTASGKTTLLRAMIQEIPLDEHLVILEDTYEIINQHPRQTSFLAKKNEENKSLKDYCSYALRMSPDRMAVGEMRSHEVVPFILAMNTGHKGLMSTIHANSAIDAISRAALLFSLYSGNQDLSFELVTKLICKSIDIVIHLEKKRIVEICQIIGSQGETPFYEMLYSQKAA